MARTSKNRTKIGFTKNDEINLEIFSSNSVMLKKQLRGNVLPLLLLNACFSPSPTPVFSYPPQLTNMVPFDSHDAADFLSGNGLIGNRDAYASPDEFRNLQNKLSSLREKKLYVISAEQRAPENGFVIYTNLEAMRNASNPSSETALTNTLSVFVFDFVVHQLAIYTTKSPGFNMQQLILKNRFNFRQFYGDSILLQMATQSVPKDQERIRQIEMGLATYLAGRTLIPDYLASASQTP